MNPAEAILLVRLKSIGDVLFTLPAVGLLRDNRPRARIAFLTSSEHAAMVRGFGALDEVLALDRGLYRGGNVLGMVRMTAGLVRRLRRARYALAVDFQGYGETAWLTWLTRAGERWGSVYRPGRAWAYTRALRRDDALHPAEWNRTLLVRCGLERKPVRNLLGVPEADVRAAREWFGAHGLLENRPSLFIQPFTSSPQKNWPLDRYLALAAGQRAAGRQVLFGGGPSERVALAPALEAGYPVAAGTPLMVTAGLMRCCSLVVGGDTGVLHLAVAMGRRVLMLLRPAGSGDPVPFGHPDWVLASTDALGVAGIRVEQVAAACNAAFAEMGK